ncbi:MAG: isocitrate lyase/PEP mutase family protein [Thermoplasmata archaeon]
MASPVEKAEAFRALHRGSRLLVLPNAWDVPSARVFEEAGFPAVATSSAGVMASRGYPDGEEMPRRELVEVVGRVARSVRIPLSADVVAGYGRSPSAVARTVRAVLAAGAVGINLEDRRPSGEGLFSLASQVRKIQEVRRAGEAVGVPLVINARTDALREHAGSDAERLGETIRRASAYRDAGADCVYPMGLTDSAAIATFVGELRCPVNVMVRKGLPPVPELERLGVKRVSFGPSASYAALGLLQRASREILDHGTYAALVDGAITFDDLNRLAVPKPADTGV